MRIAIIGATVSAVLGGALAAMPVSSVSTPLPTGGTCGSGVQCERLASVLIPATAAPAAPAPAPPAPAPETPFTGAANTIAPGESPPPRAQPAAARAVPGGTGSGAYEGSGSGSGPGSSASTATPAAVPVLPGTDINDLGGIPNPNTYISSIIGYAALPYEAVAAATLVQGVVSAGSGLVGIGTGLVGTVLTAALAYNYLHELGIVPAISLPTSLPGAGFNLTQFEALVESLPIFQAAATNLPSLRSAAATTPALEALAAPVIQAATQRVSAGSGLNIPAAQAAIANLPAAAASVPQIQAMLANLSPAARSAQIQAVIANLPAAAASIPQLQAALAAVPRPALPALPGPGLAVPRIPLAPPPIPGPGFCVPVPLGFCTR